MVLKEIERMEFKYDVIVIGADMPAVKPLPPRKPGFKDLSYHNGHE